MSKIMISLPEKFLKQIDYQAKIEHRSRSELIREATRQYLERAEAKKRPIDNPKIRAAFKSLAELEEKWAGRWDSAKIIRQFREERYGE